MFLNPGPRAMPRPMGAASDSFEDISRAYNQARDNLVTAQSDFIRAERRYQEACSKTTERWNQSV